MRTLRFLAALVLLAAPVTLQVSALAQPVAPVASPALPPLAGFDLEPLFKTDSQVVFLPFPEYENLLGAGEEPAARAAAPFPWALRRADYAIAVTGGSARVVATFALEVLQDGFFQVPVAGGDLAFERALLDGKEVVVLPGTGTGTAPEPGPDPATRLAGVLVTGRGSHAVAVEFLASIEEGPAGGPSRITFGVPPCPISAATITIDQKEMQVRSPGGMVVSRARTQGSSTVASFSFPPGGLVGIEWMPRVAPTPASGPAPAAQAAPRVDGEVQATYRIGEEFISIESRITFTVSQGNVGSFQLAYPADLKFQKILDLDRNQVPAYEVKESGSESIVTIRQDPPDDRSHRFLVELEQKLPPGPVQSQGAAVSTTGSSPAFGPAVAVSPSVSTPAPRAAPAPAPRPTSAAVAPVATGAQPVSTASSAASSAPGTEPVSQAVVVVTTAVASTQPSSGPVPPLEMDLGFVSLRGVEQQTGSFGLVVPSHVDVQRVPPPGMDYTMQALQPGSQTRVTYPHSYQYTATPRVRARLSFLRTAESVPCEIRSVMGRTHLSPEGFVLTNLTARIVNASAPHLELWIPRRARVRTAFLDAEPVLPGAMDGLDQALGEEARSRKGAPPEGFQAIVVPLKLSPPGTEPLKLELTYLEEVPPLGGRGALAIRLPVIRATCVAQVDWWVDLPEGYSGGVRSENLQLVDPRDQGSAAASAGSTGPTTGAGQPWVDSTSASRQGEPRVLVASGPRPRPSAAAARVPVRLEPPDLPGRESERFFLSVTGPKPDTVHELELIYLSTGYRHVCQTLVFVLTVLCLWGLVWSLWSEWVTLPLAVVLLAVCVASTAMGVPALYHLFVGIVATATFWVIRLVVGPAEEERGV
ncbi:MAG: hypothetical protein HY815_13920 [Candidatus Riflebacteria bacterium]|nr:hypothetical protein [Candidatus Riflebacteria bacterium]